MRGLKDRRKPVFSNLMVGIITDTIDITLLWLLLFLWTMAELKLKWVGVITITAPFMDMTKLFLHKLWKTLCVILFWDISSFF